MQNATLQVKYLVAKADVKIAFLSSVCRTAHAHKSTRLTRRDFSPLCYNEVEHCLEQSGT